MGEYETSWARNEINLSAESAGWVGEKTYSVWVEMLRTLVPEGRTHRLSVVIAGMLQYTLEIAYEIESINEDEHSAAMSIIDATETADLDDIKG
jgi:hypothetical protein